MIAAHLLATTPAGESWTVEILRRVAARAGDQGAPDSAARYLRRALAERPQRSHRAQVLLELGIAETDAVGTVGFGYLRETLEAAGDAHERATIALEVARVLFSYAEFEQAADVVDRAGAELADDGDALAARLDGWVLGAAFWDLSVHARVRTGWRV